MKWVELKSKVRHLLLSRNLANPNIRLNALNNLEELFKNYFPEVIADPHTLLNYDKNRFKELVSKRKKLNSAESSVINNFYQLFENSSISNAKATIAAPQNIFVENECKISKEPINNKLVSIAELLSELLIKKFKIIPSYTFESKNNWLLNSPSKEIHKNRWQEISQVYSELVEKKHDLDRILEDFPNQIHHGSQRIDIWFENPINVAIEFDETQHFNQFRFSTLKYYTDPVVYSFDVSIYKTLSNAKIVKPGTSGFQKLRTFDPLFPEMLAGEKQDNRPRQRAFRDYLKDITPVIMGFNPTIRISYKTTNGKIKGFSELDIASVRDYLIRNNYIDKIKLAK